MTTSSDAGASAGAGADLDDDDKASRVSVAPFASTSIA
jgi:hypothetical protein